MQNNKNYLSFWRNSVAQFKKTKTLAGAGLLCAIGIVLKTFTISFTQVSRVSFVFLVLAIAGYLYGPFVAGFVGIIIDIIGFFTAPSNGPFVPLFTLVAFCGGFIYGVWLYQRPLKLWRTFVANLTHTIITSFLLNPLFLHFLYGKAFIALVIARIPINLIMLPLGTFLIFVLQKALSSKKSFFTS